jgi:hypothetical protein
MTNELKELMTETVDAQAPYAPDVDALVRAGRGHVRRRCILMSVAAVAAVCVVAAATTLAVNATK